MITPSPFYIWGNRGTEKSSNFVGATKYVSGDDPQAGPPALEPCALCSPRLPLNHSLEIPKSD